jgi:lactate racemase
MPPSRSGSANRGGRGRFELPFGSGRMGFSLPGTWTKGTIPRTAKLEDPVGAMRKALASPLGGAPLADLARGARSVVLSIPDLTRPFPSGTYLPALLDALEAAGVPREGIRAIVATGVHRPLVEDELRAILGPAAGRIRADNHDPHGGLSPLGTTARGTPVLVNSAVDRADLAVSLGSVAFHFHAGFGGGRKGIVPGLAGEETARKNHLLALSGPGDSWHPGSGPGLLEGNPVHEDLLEAALLLRAPVFLVNFVPGGSGAPVSVHAGDLRAAHASACAAYGKIFSRAVEDPFDAVVVSAGGMPRDVNLIQAHKAAAHAAGALREGGTLVLVAECPEGMGHADLEGWFGTPPGRMRALSEETGRKYVQTAYSFQDKARRFDFLVAGRLPAEPLRRAGMVPVESAEEVRAFLLAKHGKEFRGLAVPDSSVLYARAGVRGSIGTGRANP